MSRDASPGGGLTPRRKEKKRVGFHQGEGDKPTSHVIGDSYVVPQQQQPPPPTRIPVIPRIETPEGDDSTDPFATPSATPKPQSPTPAGAPDATELRRALSRILTSIEDGAGPPGHSTYGPGLALGLGLSAGQGAGSDTPPPQRPRPALRRDTSYDVPEERQKADRAERATGERAHKSGLAARERAYNLAVRVENYTSPHPSRRGSNDSAPFRPSFDSEEDGDDGRGKSTGVLLGDWRRGKKPAGATQDSNNQANLRSRPRKNSHLAAENLVRVHSRRVKQAVVPEPEDYFRYEPPPGTRSGAATPILEQSYAHDYVPRPRKYHSGILSSLLKLYNDCNSGGSSGRTTPGSVTPNASPPSSGPPSTAGSPSPSRPGSGVRRGGHQRAHSHSPAMTGLLKSTSTLMAPGSSMYSGSMADKIKQEEPTPRAKKRRSDMFGVGRPKQKQLKDDKIRITKHIARILSRHKYLVKLCRALMMYGAPTHRLEEYMTMSARVLEIEGQFLYIPGCMIISFDDSSTHTTEVKIVRAPQGVDLGKLRDVHEIYKEVVHDHISADDATTRLDSVLKRKLKFGNWLRVPVYGLASVCVAPFAFEGRFIDLPIAFLLGCLLGWMQLILAPSNELYANVFEISAAIATSFLARAFGSIRGGELFCFSALAQSSIALILPGYMVLCSALELQSHNLVAGSVRMVYAMIYTLFLGYGITIGTALYGMIDRQGASSATHCTDPLHRNWCLLFVPGFTMCLCVINQAKWKQTPVMLAISLAGFLANSYSSTYFQGNSQISNMLGALTVGILANLYSRLGRHVYNFWLDLQDWWDLRVRPRFKSVSRRRNEGRRGEHRPIPEMYQMRSHNGSKGNVGASSDVEADSLPGTLPSTAGFPTCGRDGDRNHGEEKDSDDGDDDDGNDNGGTASTAPPRQRTVGYGLAAAAMLPAIFVQVPSGLAASGSLLAGVTTANQITNTTVNGTSPAAAAAVAAGSAAATAVTDSLGASLNNSAFNVMFSVIQVAIGITVGLFLSALIVYPLGKRRSGLLSF